MIDTFILHKKFSELEEEDLEQLKIIYDANRPERKGKRKMGAYLIDETDYAGLISYSKQRLIETGRLFMAIDKNSQRCIGFMLCLDNVEMLRDQFPLHHFAHYVIHDIPFLQDLAHLGAFGYVYQVAVLPEFHNNGAGSMMIAEMEQFYERSTALILGAGIHEGQYLVIKILKKSGRYLFLDQYFSPVEPDQLRFRIVRQLQRRELYRKINAEYLPRTFNTIIPIQLNLATADVNTIIEPMNAKILWSSFFHDNELLRVYRMDSHYTGYFGSILEAKSYPQFQELVPILKKIVRYLRDKDDPNLNQPSLTPLVSKKGLEFFFANDAWTAEDLPSFGNPAVYNLQDEEMLDKMLGSRHFHSIREELSNEEWLEWTSLLSKLAKVPKHKNIFELPRDSSRKRWKKLLKAWKEWKRRLSITSAEEKQLLEDQRAINAKSSQKKEVSEEMERINAVSKARGKISNSTRRAWQDWLELHQEVYAADQKRLKHPERYWWCHAVVPMTFSGGVSGIMFTFRYLKPAQSGPGEQGRRQINGMINTIVSALSKNMLNIIMKLQEHAIEEAANRYAVSVISSRNISHNLGSHILSRFSQTSNLGKLVYGTMDQGDYIKVSDLDENLRKVTDFLSYLRTRMNLLADLSTSEPVASVAAMLNLEVLEPLRQQEVVNKFISGTDIQLIDIEYENHLDTLPGKRPDRRDIMVQIPNGELGISALAMILENIIRNTAKHEILLDVDYLLLTVKVVEEDDRGYTIYIHDNIDNEREVVGQLADQLNRAYIEAKLFEKNYEVRKKGWGIAEMDLAASYLRKKMPGLPVGGEHHRKIPFLKAVPLPLSQRPDRAYLGYQIYLKKPREILIVDSRDRLTHISSAHQWIPYGIKILTKIAISEKKQDIHTHNILLLLDFESRSTNKRIKRFPYRWLVLQDEVEQENLKQKLNEDPTAAICWIWEKWLNYFQTRKYLNDLQLTLYLYGLPALSADENRSKRRPEDSPMEAIIFDAHGSKMRKRVLNTPRQFFFYNAFGTTDPLGKLLIGYNKLKAGNQKRKLEIELMESAITQVVVIDERIQEEAYKKKAPFELAAKDFFEYLSWLNLFVPNPDEEGIPCLYHQYLEENTEQRLIEWIHQLMHWRRMDFLIFHVGLLEKLIGDIDEIERWIQKHFIDIDPRIEIILISGRGKPHRLPLHFSFQQYNNIVKYVIDTPSKFHLCRMLFGARTRLH
ncbi:hypothetical protein [Flavilitoribacter nigricans]|uniref:Uncharacterized protein n=1 Tax=Flavilitoribacter nigricans (strain ATCC 23147 / DSM 23189 / NBRC 102662 / NCIMB 1420 / SS-2) TaxID=1122177 RepID=A0A2D0NH17_FLAN2|nr:hypothetical protein [Flavilitoribacter nigricans]PHN07785.1 hypothetical protein CRP01_04500 [Flavilitoribacter nigricans DSM 23189 = NBRC 102662]